MGILPHYNARRNDKLENMSPGKKRKIEVCKAWLEEKTGVEWPYLQGNWIYGENYGNTYTFPKTEDRVNDIVGKLPEVEFDVMRNREGWQIRVRWNLVWRVVPRGIRTASETGIL